MDDTHMIKVQISSSTNIALVLTYPYLYGMFDPLMQSVSDNCNIDGASQSCLGKQSNFE